ncbi:MAG: aspartate/glutamate racemase family protein [Clostridiales bacterium]|nr:aspartate/glutamate racemase family protein [Clostridiales bacterium]
MRTDSTEYTKNKAAFFHTTTATVLSMKNAFEKRYPDAELISMLDDSVLPEVLANHNMPTKAIIRRLIQYAQIAEEQGADVFVCMCTTLGLAIRKVQEAVTIPVISIDGPMLREAVHTGQHLALLITFAPTAEVSKATAEAYAHDAGRDAAVDILLVEGARDALNRGDKAEHDRLIREKAEQAVGKYDVIVFAQVSMTDAAHQCEAAGMHVLYGMDSGVEQIKNYFK